MVAIEKKDDKFIFKMQGLHKLWAMRSKLSIPKEHIVKAYLNEKSLSWVMGLRMPGTHIPGLITAGTYIMTDGTIFCDVVKYKRSIVVELKDEYYSKLIVEVKDPEKALALLSET